MPRGLIKWIGIAEYDKKALEFRESIVNDLTELEAEECELIGKIQYMQDQLEKQCELAREDKAIYLIDKDLKQLLSHLPSNMQSLGVAMPSGSQLDISWKKKLCFQNKKKKRKRRTKKELELDGFSKPPKKLKVELEKNPIKVLNEYDFNLHVSNKHKTVKEKVPIDVRILTEVMPGPTIMPEQQSLAQNYPCPPSQHPLAQNHPGQSRMPEQQQNHLGSPFAQNHPGPPSKQQPLAQNHHLVVRPFAQHQLLKNVLFMDNV